jgi:hypothetical protein
VFYNLNPLTLLLIKKEIYSVKSRAREQQEYTFAKHQYTPSSPTWALPCSLFILPYSELPLKRHFISIRSTHCSYLPPVATSLSASLSFTRLAPQTTRLRLKQLNKPRAEPDRFALVAPCYAFCALNACSLCGLLVTKDSLCSCLLGLLGIKRCSHQCYSFAGPLRVIQGSQSVNYS